MKIIGILLLAGLLLLTGCAFVGQRPETTAPSEGYHRIDQDAARQMMEQDDGHIIVDVRRFDEYREGHIPGAICIPNESIDTATPQELPNPGQTLLIYCRSGNRSKEASEKLAAMGYTNIYEFGGIIDWTGPVASGQTLAVTVASNPTTGFRWEARQEQELFEVREFYTAAPQSQPVSGGGGWQTFLLTPKEVGAAAVSFTYLRPWEPVEGDPRFSYTLAVSEDLSVTVTEDGSAEAAAQGYAPSVRIYG